MRVRLATSERRGQKRAVFLDKDGTLVVDRPYNVDPALIELAPGAELAVRELTRAGFQLVIVSNQSGVARGLFDEEALTSVEARLRELVDRSGGVLSGFYYCPHHPEGVTEPFNIECDCRKPKPGMIHRAGTEQGIDLEASWMIGDILHDIEAGNAAGCRTILIDNGNETEWRFAPSRVPDFIARDLGEAARFIMEEENAHRTDEPGKLEGLEEDSLRAFGCIGRCLDDGAGDSRDQGKQFASPDLSADVTVRSGSGATLGMRG